MTSPNPRDEAVAHLEKAASLLMMHDYVTTARQVLEIRKLLSAAKPPASGVDAVREAWSFLQDRLLEFEQEIGSGEEEREWAGHVHPALSRFNSLLTSLSPAATSGSEAGGEA